MKELERRALMGDREAQKECTEQGIALPCPFCGNENVCLVDAPELWYKCMQCGTYGPEGNGLKSALAKWNTRPALPVHCEPFEIVSEFEETERGDNGFGSTGR